jgi:DNA (cytosine-5)-methyltransferase 1
MYCGPGGIALAATRAKTTIGKNTFSFQHVWATDYDPDTCQTYARNILKHSKGAQIICKDARKLEIGELPVVDGFLYGFPCNDFSSVGESKGMDGKFGPLYKYGIEFINKSDPLFIFAENVSGLSSANSGTAFETILKDLREAGKHGYTLTTHLYKFEDYGVPQARHRYIIIGMRKDLGVRFEVPKPSGKLTTCRQAIEVPPISSDASNNELTKQAKQVVERLSFINPGENAWTATMPENLRLNVKGAQLSQIYKRLDPKRPSYTITGSGGGGTHVYHWAENRALTNRERARLQTFPDDFEFFGSKESVRKQIGMAVPPDGAQIILEAVLKTLAGKHYQSVKPSKGYLS